MGQGPSTITPPAPELRVQERAQDMRPYHGCPVPSSASLRPEDRKQWYTDFFEQAYVVPDEDGTSVIAFPASFRGEGQEPEWQRADDPNQDEMVNHAAAVYEYLGEDHPRLVRYLGRTPSGIRLERLTPGPFPSLLPTPTSPTTLLLYHRWALHALSALHFLHTHSILLNDFCSTTTWLRSDLSLAVVGLLDATITGIADPPGTWHSESFRLGDPPEPSVQADLFDWATWVWRLMNGGEGGGEEVMRERGDAPEAGQAFVRYQRERVERGEFPVLGEERLGGVVGRAWRLGYGSVEEAMRDVKAVVEGRGGRVEGDEVVGVDWGRVFKVEVTTGGQRALKEVDGEGGEVEEGEGF